MAVITLPPVPANITPTMRGFVDRYVAAFNASGVDEDEDVAAALKAAANDVQLYPAMTTPNLATKLLVSLHFLHPARIGNQLAIDPEDFDLTAGGEMLLGTLADALRLSGHQVADPVSVDLRTPIDRAEWDRNLGAYREASRAYGVAIATMDAMSEDDPDYAGASQRMDAAMAADTAAEVALIATPAPDLAAARIKAEIIHIAGRGSDHMPAVIADLTRFEGNAA